MTTPQDSIEAMTVRLDREAETAAAKVLRLSRIHDRLEQLADHRPKEDALSPEALRTPRCHE
jgi:hypothetical protein